LPVMMKLWNHLTKREKRAPRIPDRMRIYAIGDIHGRADLLNRIHRAIQTHAETAGPEDNYIVYLGDYVDRGLQVKTVIDMLATAPPEGFIPVFLKGNHEEMLLEFIGNAEVLEDWLNVGGQATLVSYGLAVPGYVSGPDHAEKIRQEFLEAFPKAHHDFLLNLRLFFQAGDYLFVHAGIRPGIALEKQDPADLAWIREPFLSARKKSPYRVVHGHNITREPEVFPFRIGVDTGAYATGRLSCVMLEADRVACLTIDLKNVTGNGRRVA